MALTDELKQAFERVDLCFLGTSGEGGPNVVPIGFKSVWQDKLVLVDLFFDKTRKNLESNPRVAVAVGWMGPKGGFQLKGNATIHRSGDAYEEARRILRSEGSDIDPFAAVVIDVDEAHRLDPGAAERVL